MRPARVFEAIDVLAVIAVAAVIVVALVIGHSDSPPLGKGFAKFQAQKRSQPERTAEVSVALVGDMMLSRDVARQLRERGGVNYPFLATRDYLKAADITFGNLESPITAGRDIAAHEMVFRADPGVEAALKRAGFDVLCLANNHVLDFGEQGLRDTLAYVRMEGIDTVGAGFTVQDACEPAYITRDGMTLAFLAFCDADLMPTGGTRSRAQIAPLDERRMAAAVGAARRRADAVIVAVHAGTEYDTRPSRAQAAFARAAIDAGADLVVGHHPHVVQRVERYKGRYILYSLGNFVFDQMWSEETKRGLIARAFFDNGGLNTIEFVPVVMEKTAQPRVAQGNEAASILKECSSELGRRRVFAWDGKRGSFALSERRTIDVRDSRGATGFKTYKIREADGDGDGVPERYELRDGVLRVTGQGRHLWSTSELWWVDDFTLADSTGDGTVDINMSVWKAGSFGTTKPFWVRENDWSVKNHFFVFGWRDGVIRPLWQSSNLDAPNREFTIDDVDGDGRQELVTLEGDYSDADAATGRYVAVWRWREWGFFNEWRSLAGHYRNLSVEAIGERRHIVVDVVSRASRPVVPER